MAEDLKNILVIKLSAMGDFILALGAMEAIRRKHPQAKITLLTTKPFVDLGKKSGYFDEIIETRRHNFFELGEWWKLISKLRKGCFDRVYDLQMNDRTKIYRLFLQKKARLNWSGVIKGSNLFYPNLQWRQMHGFDRHVEVLKYAGIEDVTYPDLSWMGSDIDHFNIKKPFVLLVPGSAPSRPGKRWPARRYGGLAKYLVRDGYTVVVLGTKDEQDVIERIKKICPEIHDLSGCTTLFDIAAFGHHAVGAIGNDTGPIHLISMTGCPTLALFSAYSDPAESAPRGADVKIIHTDDLEHLPLKDVQKNFKPRA